MRLRGLVILALAVLFGGVAVFAAQIWIQTERRNITNQARQPVTNTVVAAAIPLRFGDLLQRQNLIEIPWPAGALPVGAFKTRDELLKGGVRYVKTAIESNEPVLAWKVTGPGQRATLSAALDEGMKAVTIRVNDILGVAGFIQPGDRVDILLTRNVESQSYVDVLLQGVKVLAVDQIADDRREKPAIAKAITLEVSTIEAQKLTLAASVGQLSLTLRNVASAQAGPTRRVTMSDLSGGGISSALVGATERIDVSTESTAGSLTKEGLDNAKPPPPLADNGIMVGVVRNLKRSEYRVNTND